jgi:uncharacterized membrane protein
VLSALAVAPPLLARGFPAGHDTTAHLTYVYLFDAALSQGQFPVRWVEWIRPGHSQPLFNFYQPGLYYTVQVVHALVPSLLLSIKATILGAWWCGAAFLLLYLRPLGWWPATLGALLFIRAPYLLLDVFVRAAFPEFLALSCAPVVLWSLDRTLRANGHAPALALAAATGLMLVCHLPTVLMFLPVFATYAASLWLTGDARARFVPKAALAVALGAGLACFYVAPALLELRFTKMFALTSAYYDYRQHFVEPWQWVSTAWGYGGSEPGLADRMSFQVGVLQWIALGLGLVTAIVCMRRRERYRAGWLLYWLCAAAAALFMTSAASIAIWRVVPPLSFVQFPWRFLTVVSLAASIVAAIALSSLRKRTTQAVVVLCVAAGLSWQTHGLLKPSHYLPRQSVFIDNPGWRFSRGASGLAFIEPGYFPATVERLPGSYVNRWEITRGRGVVSPREVLDHRIVLAVHSADGLELTITSHAFPGWHVLVDGAAAEWRTEPDFGFIVVRVPAGSRVVEAVFGDTPVRAWSNRVSLLSALLWGGFAIALAARARPRGWRREPELADAPARRAGPAS